MEDTSKKWIEAVQDNRMPEPANIPHIERADLHEIRDILDGMNLEHEHYTPRKQYSGRGRRYNSSGGGLVTFFGKEPTENGTLLEIALSYRRLDGGLHCKEVEKK